MTLDCEALAAECLLRGMGRVCLHWKVKGGYYSNSWDARRPPNEFDWPARNGYLFEGVSFEKAWPK